MLNATVKGRVDITPDLLILSVEPDSDVPDFLPGQYVALGLPGSAERAECSVPEPNTPNPEKLIKRAYSIGSSPAQKDRYEFYLAIVPNGALTSRLAVLEPGDRLFVAPKVVGAFTLCDVPDDNNLILVCTGTGIAPYISMLRTESTWCPGRRITLVHGVRYSSDLAYRKELLELEKKRSEFKYFAAVSREDPDWDGPRGYVQHFFEQDIIKADPARDNVFICGNPAMINDLQEILVKRGYKIHSRREPGNLHLEKYW